MSSDFLTTSLNSTSTGGTPGIPSNSGSGQNVTQVKGAEQITLNSGASEVKQNKTKLTNRAALLFVPRKKFNESMISRLNSLTGKLNALKEGEKLESKIDELRENIHNSKIWRGKVYREYKCLKKEIEKFQNKKNCDDASNELNKIAKRSNLKSKKHLNNTQNNGTLLDKNNGLEKKSHSDDIPENNNIQNNQPVENQKGKHADFITNILCQTKLKDEQGNELDDKQFSNLKAALNEKLKSVDENHRLNFKARANRVTERANKIKAGFEKINGLKNAGKISESECNEYKKSLVSLFADTKSGPTHSIKFNIGVKRILSEIENTAKARTIEAHRVIINYMKDKNDYSLLKTSCTVNEKRVRLFCSIKDICLENISNNKTQKADNDTSTSVSNFLSDTFVLKEKISDNALKNALDKRLDHILKKYGDNEGEFEARAKRVINRAKEIDDVIYNLSEDDKMSFIKLLDIKIKINEICDLEFGTRLRSLEKEIQKKNDRIKMDDTWTFAGNGPSDEVNYNYKIDNPFYDPKFENDDPFIKEFEEGF